MHGGGDGMDPRVHTWGGVGLEVKVWGIYLFIYFFFKNDTLFSFQSRTEDLTLNVRGLCPRLSIHVSSVYCSKIDLSF